MRWWLSASRAARDGGAKSNATSSWGAAAGSASKEVGDPGAGKVVEVSSPLVNTSAAD